jgi:hypothetical protein
MGLGKGLFWVGYGWAARRGTLCRGTFTTFPLELELELELTDLTLTFGQ